MGEFSQSYAYSHSPAYTPDGSAYNQTSSRLGQETSSPSYQAAAAYTPTFSPTHSAFGAHYGSPGTSAYSPPGSAASPYDAGGIMEPTSPVDTPMAYSPGSPGGHEYMSPAVMSPGETRGAAARAAGSPIVQEFYDAPNSPTADMMASPSYTPHMPRGGYQAPVVGADATEVMSHAEDSDDDDAMSAILEPADE